MAMYLILLSQLSVSLADLDSKAACALQTKHSLKEGTAAQPVICTLDEVLCHDHSNPVGSCHPKSAGCPVTCPPGEHVCHSPPSCEGCDGYNWCSMSTCPVYCGMNETLCHDPTTMTDSCHPKSAGCPVTCPRGDQVCHEPPSCDGCDAHNWCAPTCPRTCGSGEMVCYDYVAMTESCHPVSTGCPITCAAGEHLCKQPPMYEGGHGSSWCSTSPCPVTCSSNEIPCWDSRRMMDTCYPMSTGCPVTCARGEHVCHEAPTCPGCHGYSWCSPSPCPITCGIGEVVCHDSYTMTDSCHDAGTGCPVTCAPGENLCHEAPTCPGCHGYSWCSPSACPITCGPNEIICHDPTGTSQSCYPMTTGCP